MTPDNRWLQNNWFANWTYDNVCVYTKFHRNWLDFKTFFSTDSLIHNIGNVPNVIAKDGEALSSIEAI